MNKETKKKLLAPFPKEYRRPAPKGRFGKYVPHYRYVERLRDCLGDNYGWKVEAVYGIYKGEQRIVGAKGTITIEGLGTFDGVGDVKDFQLSSQADGANYKFAESDAFKRACMHFGLGVELWSGDETEEEFMVNEAHKTKPIQKTGTVKDIVIEKEEQEALNKAKQNFAKDVGAEEDSVSDQLNDILEGMCTDKQIRSELKKKSYDKCIEQGMSKEVDDWSDDEMKTFLTFFGDLMNENAELLSAVTTDISDTKMQCPEQQCNKFEWIVDNREKKASDDKFANIPDFTCDNYGPDKDGCGKGWYIGSKDFPFDKWL